MFGKMWIDPMPEVRAAAEAGAAQCGEAPKQFGFAVPVDTLTAVANQLSSAGLQKAISTPSLTPSRGSAEAFARKSQVDNEGWGAAVNASQVNAE